MKKNGVIENMCQVNSILYVIERLGRGRILGSSVLEVGSADVNGSVRGYFSRMGCYGYLGVDVERVLGVDEVCYAEELVGKYGERKFDLVICLDLLEHVRDYRRVIWNLKSVLEVGGELVVSAAGEGFFRHCHPYDFWRFRESDFKVLFGDFEVLDVREKGLCVYGHFRKPSCNVGWDSDVSRRMGWGVKSTVTGKYAVEVSDQDIERFNRRRKVLEVVQKVIDFVYGFSKGKLEKWVLK